MFFHGQVHGLVEYFADDLEEMKTDMIDEGLPDFTSLTTSGNIYAEILEPGRWPTEGGGKGNLLSETVKVHKNRSDSCDPPRITSTLDSWGCTCRALRVEIPPLPSGCIHTTYLVLARNLRFRGS